MEILLFAESSSVRSNHWEADVIEMCIRDRFHLDEAALEASLERST